MSFKKFTSPERFDTREYIIFHLILTRGECSVFNKNKFIICSKVDIKNIVIVSDCALKSFVFSARIPKSN